MVVLKQRIKMQTYALRRDETYLPLQLFGAPPVYLGFLIKIENKGCNLYFYL